LALSLRERHRRTKQSFPNSPIIILLPCMAKRLKLDELIPGNAADAAFFGAVFLDIAAYWAQVIEFFLAVFIDVFEGFFI